MSPNKSGVATWPSRKSGTRTTAPRAKANYPRSAHQLDFQDIHLQTERIGEDDTYSISTLKGLAGQAKDVIDVDNGLGGGGYVAHDI